MHENYMEKSLWKEAVGTAAVIVLAVLVGAFVMKSQKVEDPQAGAVHFHAGFQIYNEDGARLDFSGMEYMEIAPCGPGDLHEDDTVHLHNGVGDVVHVHHAYMTWKNLLEYLQARGQLLPSAMGEPTSSLGLTGFVNKEEVPDIRFYPIKPHDSVVIIVGNLGPDYLSKLEKRVTIEHIKEAEAQKENCGS